MLLRDVFDIPEKVDSSDFVLQLESGVTHAERTLQDYVVTPSVARSLDDALGLVQRTLQGGTAKGAFVHGSFGSGKSHFMAVLHLLLTGNASARALPGLQEIVAKRQPVLDAKLLAVDYHLLGAESFEGALFEGYAKTVERLHPTEPAPVLHRSEELFTDARHIRQRLGDEAFFDGLNEGQASSGWGKRSRVWDADTYDAAVNAPVGDAQRTGLVNALIRQYFVGYRRSGEWLDIQSGLEVMTQHAADLGYDGLVLFLDELVLWLAQHLSDTHFIQSETSKVARLVETGMGTLPVPMVSFVARQRDLKDFLGGDAGGAEQAAIGQSFTWWEERFERIELEAADLPQIVQRRLLTPVSEEARQAVERAVATVQADSAAWGYLLTDSTRSSGQDFERTYPFSPALVDAMVALSALMQRERTALRIMGELLSDSRDTRKITDVIPAGDLFDAVVLGGKDPLTAEMKALFDNAREFYRSRMRPYLLDKHGLTEVEEALAGPDHPFRTEDRLAKTLLIASLAPGAPSLRNLTAAKLAALNYGTVQTFIPGAEAQRVMEMVRAWAAEFGEVRIGDGSDPVISLGLTGVNYEALLESVRHEDSEPNRRKLIRNLLSEELGVKQQADLTAEWTTTVLWRGAKRDVDVVFGNIRDEDALTDEAFRAQNGRWKVVIDYPFDEGTHSLQDDLNRLTRLREAGLDTTTLAWLPYFLTPQRMAEVGRLCQLDYLLTGERFEQAARGLNPTDREPARQALDNNRRSLRLKVTEMLRQAYGVSAPVAENVDPQVPPSETVQALTPGVMLQPPVVANLRGALESLVRQALDAQYPEHPRFEPDDAEIRRADLATVLDHARRALDAGGRLDQIDRPKATVLRRVAVPLGVGDARETVYALSADSFRWLSDLNRWASEVATDGEVRVADLRSRLRRYGMVGDVEDLLLLVWAAVEDREWTRAGTRIEAPGIGGVTADMVVRPARLPGEAEWSLAVKAAAGLFGVPRPSRRSAAGAAHLAGGVRASVGRLRGSVRELVTGLETHAAVLRLDGAAPKGRLATARRTAELLDALARETDDTVLLRVLAAADVPDEPQAMARSMSSASDVAAALRGTDWKLIGSAVRLPEGRGEPILDALAQVASAEELHAPLAPALRAAADAVREALLATSMTTRTERAREESATDSEITSRTTAVEVDEIELQINEGHADLNSLVERLHAAARLNPRGRLRVRWWFE